MSSEEALYKVNGRLTEKSLEALVCLQVIGGVEIEAIIDTGFTGALMLPEEIVEELGLPWVAFEKCFLAGNVEDEADLVSAQVEWLGEVRRVDVIVKPGYLIGTQLLAGTRLTIDYDEGTVLIEKKSTS
jgi:clan AA aspartic protease